MPIPGRKTTTRPDAGGCRRCWPRCLWSCCSDRWRLLHMKAHYSALLGLATSLICSISIFGMPASLAAKTALLGAGYGLLPIGWIILNVIFMYQLTCEAGLFKVLQESLTGITQDRRLQLLLIAFSFGAFFEGAAGFGTPVAVTAAVLIGLGFKPLQASGLSLIANTAPVAYGAIGTPLIALQGVDWIGSSAVERASGTYPAVLLGSGAVLAGVGICRLCRNDRSLAGRFSGRRIFRHPTISHFELPWAVAGGRGRGRGFHGGFNWISVEVASQAHLGLRARGRTRGARHPRAQPGARGKSLGTLAGFERFGFRVGVADREDGTRQAIGA